MEKYCMVKMSVTAVIIHYIFAAGSIVYICGFWSSVYVDRCFWQAMCSVALPAPSVDTTSNSWQAALHNCMNIR